MLASALFFYYIESMNTELAKIPTPADFEDACAESGISVAKLCRMADIERSTFTKWKAGGGATLNTIEKLLAALEAHNE